MKKIIIICGLIAGLISSGWMIYYISICETPESLDNGMIFGYAAMLVAFSFVFIGIKNYRDKHGNGIITFGKAFKIGSLITLIASTIYVVSWMIDYHYFVPDFMDKYAAYTVKEMRSDGATETEIKDKLVEMAEFKEMYKNPLFAALVTYMEIVPLGLVITLISSAILRKRVVNA